VAAMAAITDVKTDVKTDVEDWLPFWNQSLI
jgi:hypothetical protein